jgi:hypothetical protein
LDGKVRWALRRDGLLKQQHRDHRDDTERGENECGESHPDRRRGEGLAAAVVGTLGRCVGGVGAGHRLFDVEGLEE